MSDRANIGMKSKWREWLLQLMGDCDFSIPMKSFDELLAALAAQAAAVPQGWKLVPFVADDAMLGRAMDVCGTIGVGSCGEHAGVDWDDFRSVWDTMLTAVPPAPAPVEPTMPAAASPLSGDVDDEVALSRAISVMEDTLGDIANWEDKALAEAIEESLVDLRAMVDCIRMRAEDAFPEPASPAPVAMPLPPLPGYVVSFSDGALNASVAAYAERHDAQWQAQVDALNFKIRELVWSASEGAALRAAPTGAQPLTPQQRREGFAAVDEDPDADFISFSEGIEFAERAHGIVGTPAADGGGAA